MASIRNVMKPLDGSVIFFPSKTEMILLKMYTPIIRKQLPFSLCPRIRDPMTKSY